ncbi:MAG: hypothetical protein CMK07_05120 [Ponticaulis sp.]|nr:hypothetical protein [Ponticaulis sp.]
MSAVKKGSVSCTDQAENLTVEESRALILSLKSELERSREKEQELIKLKVALFSRANHEFRTPLTIIDGIASRMARQSADLRPIDIEGRCETIRHSVKELLLLTEVLMRQMSDSLYPVEIDAKEQVVRKKA